MKGLKVQKIAESRGKNKSVYEVEASKGIVGKRIGKLIQIS